MTHAKRAAAIAALLGAGALGACSHMMGDSAATGQSSNTSARTAPAGGNMAAGGAAGGQIRQEFPNVKPN